MAELIARRAAHVVTVIALLAGGCAGTDVDHASPPEPAAASDGPTAAADASGLQPAEPKVSVAAPVAAPAAPTAIAGKVTRPDGSVLPDVEVNFWRRDEKGELADMGTPVKTRSDGSFEIPAEAWQPEVAALRFRWQRQRVPQAPHAGAAPPANAPVEVWLEAPAIADWSAIAVVLDTGWSVAGLVQSTDPDFDIRRIRLQADVTSRSQRLEETGVFEIKDVPWELERCAIRVYEQGQLLTSGEARRPDREHGMREAWVEILVPEKTKP